MVLMFPWTEFETFLLSTVLLGQQEITRNPMFQPSFIFNTVFACFSFLLIPTQPVVWIVPGYVCRFKVYLPRHICSVLNTLSQSWESWAENVVTELFKIWLKNCLNWQDLWIEIQDTCRIWRKNWMHYFKPFVQIGIKHG